MGTTFIGDDGTSHRATEREEAARTKLYNHVAELRAAVLDLLSLVRSSTDPVGAVTDIAWGRIESMKNQIRMQEHQDHIVRRARNIIDGTKDAETLTGPQG